MRLRPTDWSRCKPALSALSKLCHVTENGVSWSAAGLDQWTFILAGHLRFEPKLEEDIRDSVLWEAINACAKAENFGPNFFRDRALDACKRIVASPKKRYSVVAEIVLPKRLATGKAVTTALGKVFLDAGMRPREAKLYEKVENPKRYGFTFDCVTLRADIVASNEREAVSKGERIFDLVLGCIHLAFGGFGVSILSGMPRIPIGRFIRRSSIISFDLSNNTFGHWYVENHFQEQPSPQFTVPSSFNLKDVPTELAHYHRAIKSCDFSDKALRAITLFQEALCARHSDIALLKLWTIFELLCTNGSDRTPYQVIIKRAASIFPDSEAVMQRLRLIQEARNGLVHRGDHNEFVSRSAQWASLYAEQIIKFSLFSIFRFKKHAEILEYLSLGTDAIEVERRIRLNRAKLKQIKITRGKKH